VPALGGRLLLMAAPGDASGTLALDAGCACCAAKGREEGRRRAARAARRLAWASLGWMTAEGAVGLAAGLAAGSAALAGWAAGSVIEALASVIVIWRFTGSRQASQEAERRAGRAVAASFWLLAPWITAQAAYDLAVGHHDVVSVPGIAVTAASIAVMPALGIAKHRLGRRLASGATAGEGTQNLMCAAQAAAVLAGLAVTAAWPGAWPADPAVALGVAAWSAREGWRSWRGAAGCC
jgi:divalent metal cation (Fe/Co/Zn/Cd) transporter